jgi:hypothetical protein
MRFSFSKVLLKEKQKEEEEEEPFLGFYVQIKCSLFPQLQTTNNNIFTVVGPPLRQELIPKFKQICATIDINMESISFSLSLSKLGKQTNK